MAKNSRIEVDDLPEDVKTEAKLPSSDFSRQIKASLRNMLQEHEKWIIENALNICGSQESAAKYLSTSQASIARKAKKYGICVGQRRPQTKQTDGGN
jgi:transcriptional regulator with PAS, ATPase and Fis domain